MVRRIRDDGVGCSDQRTDRAGVSLRGGIFISAGYGRMAALAGVPAAFRACVISDNRSAVAYSGGVAESGYGRPSRFFLVLFRQRTLPEIPGQAVSAGLQQTSRDVVLDAASGVVVPMESVSAGGGDDRCGSVAGPTRQFGASPEWRAAGERFCIADSYAVLDLGWSGADLFCPVDQPGVLHVSGVFATFVVAGGWRGGVRADGV